MTDLMSRNAEVQGLSAARPGTVVLRPMRTGKKRSLDRALSILSPVVLLALWEIAARAGLVDVRFFPPPSAIFESFVEILRSGELWMHLSMSLVRILVGFLLGAIPGIAIGLTMGLSSITRAVVQPLVHATFPIPKVAILPLLILIFGLGEMSKYAIIAIAVVYLVLINTYEGVRDISPIYLDVGHNFGASRSMMFLDIALPGALPQILTGLRLGMGVALLVIVAAEFVGAKSGIGYMIWNSWQIFAVEKMYVGLLLTAALGFLAAGISTLMERILIPWRAPSASTRRGWRSEQVMRSMG
jgi:ABC-type nitrate/sulfonate/bicarbonate transport system permease component